MRKWRKRGVADCRDRSAHPRHPPWKAGGQGRAIVCGLCRATNIALGDLTFVIRHIPPRLNRDSVLGIPKAQDLSGRSKPDAPTNGMAERVNGRVASEAPDIDAQSHRALEGKTPNQAVADHLKAKPGVANPASHGRAAACDTTKARLVADAVKDVSQPGAGVIAAT